MEIFLTTLKVSLLFLLTTFLPLRKTRISALENLMSRVNIWYKKNYLKQSKKMPRCTTKLNKFKDLESKLLRLSYLSIKVRKFRKFRTPKNTTTSVKLEAKRQPLNIPKSDVSNPKSMTSNPATLTKKTPYPRIIYYLLMRAAFIHCCLSFPLLEQAFCHYYMDPLISLNQMELHVG